MVLQMATCSNTRRVREAVTASRPQGTRRLSVTGVEEGIPGQEKGVHETRGDPRRVCPVVNFKSTETAFHCTLSDPGSCDPPALLQSRLGPVGTALDVVVFSALHVGKLGLSRLGRLAPRPQLGTGTSNTCTQVPMEHPSEPGDAPVYGLTWLSRWPVACCRPGDPESPVGPRGPHCGQVWKALKKGDLLTV